MVQESTGGAYIKKCSITAIKESKKGNSRRNTAANQHYFQTTCRAKTWKGRNIEVD